jgi:hypothetical protein
MTLATARGIMWVRRTMYFWEARTAAAAVTGLDMKASVLDVLQRRMRCEVKYSAVAAAAWVVVKGTGYPFNSVAGAAPTTMVQLMVVTVHATVQSLFAAEGNISAAVSATTAPQPRTIAYNPSQIASVPAISPPAAAAAGRVLLVPQMAPFTSRGAMRVAPLRSAGRFKCSRRG